ncbi:MAG: chemotaxis protein CheC, partial [Oscillospiraceae bacterium]
TKYDELSSMELDMLREIGSIGAGNAATALSNTITKKITISVPEVKILDYNEAIAYIGSPELTVMGELVKLSGEIDATMLYLQKIEFVNLILQSLLSKTIESFDELDEMDISALTEIGNIIISSYVNAISTLTGIEIDLSVPATAVDMLASMATIPMIEYGYQNNTIMIIDVDFKCDGISMPSNLILVPDVQSLNFLMKKLGIDCE